MEKGCNLGDVVGCNTLAGYFRDGKVFRDSKAMAPEPPKAIALYERTCAAGSGTGCYYLGLMTRGGKGVPRDVAKSQALYAKACDLGEAYGCDYLASDVADSGDGAKAVELYTRGCDLGYDHSCNFAAYAYQDGKGVPKDMNRYAEFVEKSCALGSGSSCCVVAAARATGKGGVPKDEKAAAELFARSESLNYAPCLKDFPALRRFSKSKK